MLCMRYTSETDGHSTATSVDRAEQRSSRIRASGRAAVAEMVVPVAAGPSLHCRSTGAPARPHVFMFMADDLGFLDVSYAGSTLVSTPHLDALAQHATILSHFRAPTWCAPSRAAFLTGRHGWEVGMSSAMGWTALGRDSMLLPVVLSELGYRTAIVGKLHLNPKTCARHFTSGGPFGCGFDHQYGFVGGMSDYWEHHQTWSRDGRRLREDGYMTSLLAAEAERLVHMHASGAHGNASLFLWLSLNAPHVPLQAPREWIDRQPASIADPSVRTYAAMVGAMDDAFGRTVSALRTTGMVSNSLILFASDNGGPIIPAACNGGLRGGKGSPYEGGVRAPAFVYWPACLGEARRVSRVSAHMVDLFATIVSAASGGMGDGPPHKVLANRLRKKAPHSLSLWGALTSGVSSGDVAAGGAHSVSADPPELARRQLVLQVSASSSSVMRGRWKLVLASKRCFGTPPEVSHESSMAGFPADRWLLYQLAEEGQQQARNRSTVGRRLGGGGGGSGRRADRINAARALGVDVQLYDLHTDPAEANDLLGGGGGGGSSSGGSSGGGGHRNETSIAAAMLGHYLAAVRIGRRSIERAYEEKRLNKGGVMVLWFCRQVEFSWLPARWQTAHNMMCYGRTPRERRQLVALADEPHVHAAIPSAPLASSHSHKARRGSRGSKRAAGAAATAGVATSVAT